MTLSRNNSRKQGMWLSTCARCLLGLRPKPPKIPQEFFLAAARFSKTLFALRAAFSMNFSIKNFPVPRWFLFQFFTFTHTFPLTKAFAERAAVRKIPDEKSGLGDLSPTSKGIRRESGCPACEDVLILYRFTNTPYRSL